VLGIAIGRSELIPFDDSDTRFDVATLAYGTASTLEEMP
jgi:hypothetical protein